MADPEGPGLDFHELSRRLREQDNRCTADPVFQVRTRRRVYGMDPTYGGSVVWLDADGEEVDPGEAELMEEEYGGDDGDAEGWTRTSYVDEWEVVAVFFTARAAEEYVERHRHNLVDPHVYAAAGNGSPEWVAVRRALMADVVSRGAAARAWSRRWKGIAGVKRKDAAFWKMEARTRAEMRDAAVGRFKEALEEEMRGAAALRAELEDLRGRYERLAALTGET